MRPYCNDGLSTTAGGASFVDFVVRPRMMQTTMTTTIATSATTPPTTPPISAPETDALLDDATTRSSEVAFGIVDGIVVNEVDGIDDISLTIDEIAAYVDVVRGDDDAGVIATFVIVVIIVVIVAIIVVIATFVIVVIIVVVFAGAVARHINQLHKRYRTMTCTNIKKAKRQRLRRRSARRANAAPRRRLAARTQRDRVGVAVARIALRCDLC